MEVREMTIEEIKALLNRKNKEIALLTKNLTSTRGKLATAVEALEKISEVQNLNPFGKDFDVTKAVNKAIVMRGAASQALAEIGGEDE